MCKKQRNLIKQKLHNTFFSNDGNNKLRKNSKCLFYKDIFENTCSLPTQEHMIVSYGTQTHLQYLSDHLPRTHSRPTAQSGPMGPSADLQTTVAGLCLSKTNCDRQRHCSYLQSIYHTDMSGIPQPTCRFCNVVC